MKDIALVAELESRLEIPVMIHNNCSALALSEYRHGGYDHRGSMFTFLLRTGVNGAFVHDDEIYVNSRNQTIETGHIPINADGPRCSCVPEDACRPTCRTLIQTLWTCVLPSLRGSMKNCRQGILLLGEPLNVLQGILLLPLRY